jgi:hypothetical protein
MNKLLIALAIVGLAFSVQAESTNWAWAVQCWYYNNVSTNLPSNWDTVYLRNKAGGVVSYEWFIDPHPTKADLIALWNSTNVPVWKSNYVAYLKSDVTEWDAQVKALALVYLNEINLLRAEHGLPVRTKKQLRTALENKLKD